MNTLSILTQIQAENLLQGSFILTQIAELDTSLRYASDGAAISFDDFYLKLQEEVESIQRIELNKVVRRGSESAYQTELISALEEIQDDIERKRGKIIFFMSRVKDAQGVLTESKATFEAWYNLAAQDVLKQTEINLPAASLKALGSSEFSRLTKRLSATVDSLSVALTALLKQLDNKLKMAQNKYAMGKEQALASWTNTLPGFTGVNAEAPRFGLLQGGEAAGGDEDEEELAAPARLTEAQRLTPVIDEKAETFQATVPEPTPIGVAVAQSEGHLVVRLEHEPVDGLASITDAKVTVVAQEPLKEVQASVSVREDAPVTATIEDKPPVIKGTFVKYGDPSPATILSDPEPTVEPLPAIEDDEERQEQQQLEAMIEEAETEKWIEREEEQQLEAAAEAIVEEEVLPDATPEPTLDLDEELPPLAIKSSVSPILDDDLAEIPVKVATPTVTAPPPAPIPQGAPKQVERKRMVFSLDEDEIV
jgi:hypothetical protein